MRGVRQPPLHGEAHYARRGRGAGQHVIPPSASPPSTRKASLYGAVRAPAWVATRINPAEPLEVSLDLGRGQVE
eukprot:15447922-Alexandrium_andersonii.AAC.1